jgi:hypothetical protein
MKKIEIYKDLDSGKSTPEKIRKIGKPNYKLPTLRRGRVIFDRDGITYKDNSGVWHFADIRHIKSIENLPLLED